MPPKILLSPHTTWVCFCDLILQSAHKHHPGDTLGEDGKSKLILSAIFRFPPQTDLLRDERKKKKCLNAFFPPFNKSDAHLGLSKREQEEDGNIDIKMSPALKSQEKMKQTQFPQCNGLAKIGLSLMG